MGELYKTVPTCVIDCVRDLFQFRVIFHLEFFATNPIEWYLRERSDFNNFDPSKASFHMSKSDAKQKMEATLAVHKGLLILL